METWKISNFKPLQMYWKGKEKVSEEQAAQVLLNLQTPKKKSPVDQFIFQRRTPAPTKPSGHEESSSLYVELGLTDSETESDDDVSPEINPEAQDEANWDQPCSTGTLCHFYNTLLNRLPWRQFFNDKPSDVENEKTTAEIKAESMVSVTIHQDTSAIPPMTSPVSKAVNEIVTDVVDWAIQAPLWDHFRDLPKAGMKEILHHRMWETNSYKAHEDHKKLYEALEKSLDRDHSDQLLTDLAEA
ncbi:hypothetical protein Tco_1303084 [Tanacetum coccineum]